MHVDAVAYWNAPTAMKLAREATDQSGGKLMVHVSGTPIPLPQVLEFMGPGDISTHAFNGNPESILDRNGKIRPEARAAAERGVIMDVGHAGVHCDVEVVRAALEQGLPPDTISTDIHVPPPGRTVYLMNDLVSKFHGPGNALEAAVAAATSRSRPGPGLEDSIGSLAVGMEADAAVFDLREGRFVWHDMRATTPRGSTAGHLHDGPGRCGGLARGPVDPHGRNARGCRQKVYSRPSLPGAGRWPNTTPFSWHNGSPPRATA